jgi:formate C-acetyltransferase
MRAKYRDTQPEICTSRYRLITEFYTQNPQMEGILRRAKNFRNICENIAIRIDADEVIVGAQSAKYRAAALYPENSVDWLKEEIESGSISTRDLDPYIISDEDRRYILDTIDYWMTECMSAKTDAQIIDAYLDHVGNGVTLFGAKGQTQSPVGHFCTGYDTAIRKGFAAIREEAEEKMAQIVADGVPGKTIDQYNFYRAVSIVCEGMIALTKRYAVLAAEKAAAETDPARRAELEAMADVLNHCMEKPARNFHEALQTIYLYQTCLCLDANMHGITFGRIDQYLGDFYEADLAAGILTPAYAQELMDLFYLKVAEMNKPWSYGATKSNPGYTNGMLMTLGGVKKDGTDATNPVTYMMLQTSGRLLLHDPPQSLRIHKETPPELWEAAIETTKLAGGVPTFENDDLIIPALMARGLSLESARNYCLIGCVEPAGCGDEWASPGGTGTESFMNIANALWLAMNDGFLPGATHRVGLATGHLYEMTTFDEVLDAYQKQLAYFTKWQAININSFEYIAREILPQPVISAAMDGCMEKGADVMHGGARYNSTGMSGVGIGNVADSLNMIRHLCFDTGKCTTRELYDALTADWKGYEDLHAYIKNEAPHYGNGIPDCDRYARWAGKVYSDAVNACTGPRGRYSAGLYPVTTNVMLGRFTAATPDGRHAGEPLADGISPVQQMDTNGPTAILVSVSQIDQSQYPNGTLLNMKFHPNALNGEEGVQKLSSLMEAYFGMGGMEMQINVVSAETLKEAQREPEKYKNLVVRVAGFSAYFVELHIDGQEDLIRRTELAM